VKEDMASSPSLLHSGNAIEATSASLASPAICAATSSPAVGGAVRRCARIGWELCARSSSFGSGGIWKIEVRRRRRGTGGAARPSGRRVSIGEPGGENEESAGGGVPGGRSGSGGEAARVVASIMQGAPSVPGAGAVFRWARGAASSPTVLLASASGSTKTQVFRLRAAFSPLATSADLAAGTSVGPHLAHRCVNHIGTRAATCCFNLSFSDRKALASFSALFASSSKTMRRRFTFSALDKGNSHAPTEWKTTSAESSSTRTTLECRRSLSLRSSSCWLVSMGSAMLVIPCKAT